MTTCVPYRASTPFFYSYVVDNNISIAVPRSGTNQSGIRFVENIVAHASSGNNRLHKSYNSMKNGFGCSVQILDIRCEGKLMCGDSCIARLNEIAQLQYDWNGYGAKEFSKELIEKCRCIIRSLPAMPEIYPTGRQSIQFQYELADKSYLEFEIFETKIMCLQVPQRRYSDAIAEELSVTDIDRIKEIVSRFYGQRSDAK